MTSTAKPIGKFVKLSQRLAPKVFYIAMCGIALGVLALFVSCSSMGLMLLTAGAVLLWASLLVWLFEKVRNWRQTQLASSLARVASHDLVPTVLTNAQGMIAYENAAAINRFGGRGGQNIISALERVFAAPITTLARLQSRALANGFASEVVTGRDGVTRLTVHVADGSQYVWRFVESSVPVKQKGDELALPMLILSASGTVLSVNEALRQLVGHGVGSFDSFVSDLPLRPGDVHILKGAKGSVHARTAQMDLENGQKELYFFPEVAPDANDWRAFDALPVALLRICLDGRIRQSNRPAREILRLGQAEDVNFGDAVEGLGRSVVDWVAEAAQGRSRKPEFVRASRSPDDTYLQVSLSRVDTTAGVELIAVLSDATELKSLEAQFVQSQKMQAIGQLAGGVAHDFNNLLTAISGHCDLLLLRHDKSDQDYGDLVQIHQNANRAASLVGQLLAFSRKQTLKPEVIDLRDTLADLTHLLNRLVGEKVQLTLSHDMGLLPIRADKRQLEQVIMNLVVNARDAMPNGGEVTIETRNDVLTHVLNRDRASVPEGEYVLVKVTDQGQGIPPERLQKIFEPFFTTKRTGEGTGLGLSTAYGIIKQTGGFIFVDSVVGSGTSFSIYLPAYTAQAEAMIPVNTPVHIPKNQSNERGSGVILLVEDEAPVRAFASRALRMRGYTVIEADCAEEALETLEDKELHVDIFVTDVIMPGMDGPTWVSQALRDREGVKVVFVSGYAEDHFSDQQARIPNSVFLPKPFSLSELTATVQAQLQ